MLHKLLTVLLGISILQLSEGKRCNEVLCASVVSKCILIQACKCEMDLQNKIVNECFTDCAKCLGVYYERCCSCFDMCDTSTMDLDPNESQVGDFFDPFVEQFLALAHDDQSEIDQISISYPFGLAVEELAKRLEKQLSFQKGSRHHSPLLPMPPTGLNCTVMFLSQCTSADKCKNMCYLYGAVSYRYFFNGCCECVGANCLNYGISEPKCPKCSTNDYMDYYDDEYLSDEPQQSNVIEEDYVQ